MSLMKRVRALVASLTLVLIFSSSAGANVGDYLRDRALDVADLTRLRLTVPRRGMGLGFHARGTMIAQIGLLGFDGWATGWDRRAIGVWDQRRVEYGFGPAYWTELWRNDTSGVFNHPGSLWVDHDERGLVRRQRIHWDDGRRHPFSVGGEVATPVIGLDAGFYPAEAFDLVFGLVGIDTMGDDLASAKRAQARRSLGEYPSPEIPPAAELTLRADETMNGADAEADLALPPAVEATTPADYQAPTAAGGDESVVDEASDGAFPDTALPDEADPAEADPAEAPLVKDLPAAAGPPTP